MLGNMTARASTVGLAAVSTILVSYNRHGGSAADCLGDDGGALKQQLKAEIKAHIITKKANACPMAMRIAWHSAGTYDARDGSGGTKGGTMRFEPEKSDGANAGLHIIHDLLLPIKKKYPQVSYGDLWALAGASAVEFAGGPDIPLSLGRIDTSPQEAAASTQTGAKCPVPAVPPNGRLPDASQGAAHLREVFNRMGFNDRDIVALSGGHTLGRCHSVRSGYDGPWTDGILKFNNDYFKNLMSLEWVPRQWSGPLQYANAGDGRLMMLPTDLALKQDPLFAPIAQEYATSEAAFFRDFRIAYGKLMALGCPQEAWPEELKHMGPNSNHTGGGDVQAGNSGASANASSSLRSAVNAKFREHVMHGSLERAQEQVKLGANMGEVEGHTGRSALHKGAFWNHTHMLPWLLERIDPNLQDFNGDTALHDVARFGHVQAATMLLEAGTNPHLRNAEGYTAAQLADQYEKTALAEVCRAFESRHAANASNGSNRRKGGGAGGCATFEDKWVAATDFVSTSGADRAAILAKPACSA